MYLNLYLYYRGKLDEFISHFQIFVYRKRHMMGHAKLVLKFGGSGGWRSLSDHVFMQ